VRVALFLALPALLFNVLYRFLPAELFLLALAYYVMLSIFWLNWSLIYLVRQSHWLLVALMVSILVVVAAARVLGWPIVGANMIGLAVADGLTLLVAILGLNRWARNGAGKPAVNPPRLTVLIYTAAEVFLYGLLYSAFIFTDRILAWTSSRGREDFPPYGFWLSARYELGMDLALVVLVLLAGVVEYATHEFSATLVPGEKRVRSAALAPFFDQFRRLYRRNLLIFAIAAVAALSVAAALMKTLTRFPNPQLQESLRSGATVRVFWVAALSYVFFMLALQSILILMTLSRADLAVRAIGAALIVNIVVGWAASRSIDYSASVFGLLAGSLVLAVLSHREVRRVLGELDYYYYAAY
jgi:hypothetical protein